jgi:hypothetical protein
MPLDEVSTLNVHEGMGGWQFDVGDLPKPVAIETLPLAEQPHALDCSALEPTIGGGFNVGGSR